jgi:hypothetical protein
MDNVLDIRAEEALAALFQPDTVARAKCFKIYERNLSLEPEKKLMLAVLQDGIWCFHNCALCNGQRAKEMVCGREGMVEQTGKGVDILLRKYQ